MTNSMVGAVRGPRMAASAVAAGGEPAGGAAVAFSLVDPAPGSCGAGGSDTLSAEARLLADGIGLPIAVAPGGAGRDRSALCGYVQALNDLIVRPVASLPIWEFLRARLDPRELAEVSPADLCLGVTPLWDAAELPAIEGLSAAELEARWRQRAAERLPRAAGVVRPEQPYADIWRGLPGGDFDTGGRGLDYTAGMRAFPACRAVGVESLLTLLGAFEPGERVYLDVLGGEGYVWRLLEAKRQLAQRQAVVVQGVVDGDVSTTLSEFLFRTARTEPEAVILAVDAPPGNEPGCVGRLLGVDDGRIRVSEPLRLSGADLVAWVRATTATADGAAVETASAAGGALSAPIRSRGGRPAPLMITNDVSQHMFYRAGVWGMPTREDAMRMSRTFRADSLDGVLCAYGTHHIPDLEASVRESYAILKPGGCMVVHDFFDRGPVGKWFHDVVDPYSKTGHDMPHIGPVEMAIYLFAAGFRDVELFEIDDPFVFTAEPGDEMDAREVALRYTMGMYGMSESFEDRTDELEAIIRRVLTYPELDEAAEFEADFAFIPRRAVVARAYKPLPGHAPRFAERDAELIRVLETALLTDAASSCERAGAPPEATRSLFGQGGARWELSPERQGEWLAWVRVQRAAASIR
jgi:SAM-dependent methyltransferase